MTTNNTASPEEKNTEANAEHHHFNHEISGILPKPTPQKGVARVVSVHHMYCETVVEVGVSPWRTGGVTAGTATATLWPLQRKCDCCSERRRLEDYEHSEVVRKIKASV
ncbi:hypothetical protein HAX54_016174 [Datura stramonium]|uniref:Uncharacterized protein n=1 Tax=Datura stramonium TaxID=4076 RepID=A0ABS8UKN8_DATST|nr:hypothetical protein [Datura stramonium]